MKRIFVFLLPVMLLVLVACDAFEDAKDDLNNDDVTAVASEMPAESMTTEEASDDHMDMVATEEADMDDMATEEAHMDDMTTEEADMDDMATEEADMDDMATEEADMDDMATEEAAASDDMDTMADYNAPDWTSLPLVNAHTGETFTLADFAGKTVYIEPMATWCSNCRNQQKQVINVKENTGDDVVYLSLSVEDGLANERLAQYADDNEFNWVFAVVTPDMLNALVEQFGRGVTVPPSTPHFLIAPNGSVSELSTGQHGADDLLAQIQEFAG